MFSFSATAGEDYIHPIPEEFRILFPISSKSESMECVEITISNDQDVEGAEEFVVMVTEVSPLVELSEPIFTTVTIFDNDGMCKKTIC